jgi:6,7-dimethyl-8-ribityllumazine synthase
MPIRPRPRRQSPAICVVVSRYNATVTDRLLEGAVRAFGERIQGVDGAMVEVVGAPGAFELPALCLAAARAEDARGRARFDAVVALGCLIKGETIHDRVIADAVAQGLVNVTIVTGVPVTFGVLTVNTPEQALARAGGEEGNKGADAMHAALDAVEAVWGLENSEGWVKAEALGGELRKPGLSSRMQKPDKLRRSPHR